MPLEFHQLDRRYEHLRVHDPGRQRRLLASLADSGQQTPIVVVAVTGQPDRYLVIDGYQRIAALQQLGRDTVEAVMWPMSEAEAVLLDSALRRSTHACALEDGWLLQEMEQRFGYGLEELARRLDRSVSWVSRRLALVELLPESIQQQVREGKITAHIAMKYLVPVARISLKDCERMAQAFARRRWNTRQAGQLYAAWRDGSPLIRQRILDEPELFLKTQRQVEDKAPAAPAAALLRDLAVITAIGNRASHRLAIAVPEMDRTQCQQAQSQIERARSQLAQMSKRIEKELPPDVEQSATNHDPGAERPGNQQTRDCAPDVCLSPERAQSAAIELHRVAGTGSGRESRALPATDPGASPYFEGEPRASP